MTVPSKVRPRVKIVTTLGPASREPGTVRDLLGAGADVVRLNFAHGDPEVHARAASIARAQASELGVVVGVLVDLPGPKMRTGPIAGGEVTIERGAEFTITEDQIEGDSQRVSSSVKGLADMVEPGEEIFLADGEIVLDVTSASGGTVRTSVVRGGVLRSRKGMHVPRAERSVEPFSERDRRALEAALRLRADLIGVSFVRDAKDVRVVRDLLPDVECRPLVVAKVETGSALDELDEIIEEADAVMVARGDLGIQTSLARVPLLQKEIIAACNAAGKTVITATQMLESMTRSPLPTRAEVTDVANAVLDGSDAVMLSEETAVGAHPARAVEIMAEVALNAEGRPCGALRPSARDRDDDRVSWATARAAVQAAEDVQAAAILCPTRTGSTPRRVAAFRPSMPIVGLSGDETTLGALALAWGVSPVHVPVMHAARDPREEVERAVETGVKAGLLRRGDLAVVVAGSPGPRAGRTDYLRIARV